MHTKQKNRGFTLIELVVVIAILAILAAFALPRFAQLSEQAHRSSIQGTAGALSAGVALAKAQWVTNGASQDSTDRTGIEGFGNEIISVTENGWPVSTGSYTGDGNGNATMNNGRCIDIWEELLQSNAPSVSTGSTTDYEAAGASNSCTYTYNPDGRSSTITYNAETGEVATTIN
jgi:prepilin-type N-terminal cleavage/methylation domain-containing protein